MVFKLKFSCKMQSAFPLLCSMLLPPTTPQNLLHEDKFFSNYFVGNAGHPVMLSLGKLKIIYYYYYFIH